MNNLSIQTNLCGVQLESCIMNASGPLCTSSKELYNLDKSDSGAVVTKSVTFEERKGNILPRYANIPYGSINSMGLPNRGLEYYLNYANQRGAIGNKPLYISIAGLNLRENILMLKKLKHVDNIEGVELNLSCPNIPGKPQTGYDFKRTKEVLFKAFEIYDRPLGVKLPPYFDMIHFNEMASILSDFPVSFVTCINSIGNGLYVDIEKESTVIKPKNGFGGIGGVYIKPTALANVRKFYSLLPNTQIIGCGGIQNGNDVFEHLLCGASAVQVGTLLMQEGPSCFTQLSKELKYIMKHKGYHSIEEFRGKLKEI